MFRFKDIGPQKDKTVLNFKNALLELPEKVKALESIEVGNNFNKNEKWDLVLTACVKDENSLKEYSNHPLHIAAVSIVKDIIEERACVDYKI